MTDARKPLQRVMLVEDEEDIRAVAQLALETVGGLEVVVCRSGREALERVVADAPDLVLLDVMMPEMDGPTTLAELRARPETDSIPVVMMTAKVQAGDVARYRELGAIEVIPKPFDPMTLAEQVRAIWDGWRE